MKNFIILAAALIAVMFTSCGGGNVKLLPGTTGKTGEVVVVLDKAYWESGIGQALRATIGAQYPALPQDEHLFTLVNIPASAFSNIFRTHRNLVMVEISSQYTEASLDIKSDVWATPQVLLAFTAPDSASLAACILANGDRMVHALEQAERNRVVAASERYQDNAISQKIEEVFGGSPYFPKGYKIKKVTEDFAWIQTESAIRGKYMFQAIFIYKYPYKDSTTFSLQNILAKRNEVLKKEVPGALEGSYMITATAIDPMIRAIRYKDFHFMEVRGLWDVENDYQGGPFISHSFLDKTGENIICLEAIVYAPAFEKRNYIRQTEGIIYSFHWKQEMK